MKKCYKCLNEKSLNEFHKDKSRDDGLNNLCKLCQKRKDALPSRRLQMYKNGASRRDLEFLLTLEEFTSFWDKECVYCGDTMSGIGLDRVDNSIGYTFDNVVPCCTLCNRFKWGMDKDDFLNQCAKITKHNS